MELEKMDGLVLGSILCKLGSKNASIFACVSSICKFHACDDGLWRVFCREDLDLLLPCDPSGNSCSSFKVIFLLLLFPDRIESVVLCSARMMMIIAF